MSIYKTIDKYKELVSALEEQVELYKNSLNDLIDEYDDIDMPNERESFLLMVKIEQLKKELWN